MASESTLQALFQIAKTSLYFKGLTEEDIWKACLNYQDRTDTDIQIAMQNIQAEDQKILAETEKNQNKIIENQEKIQTLRKEEGFDHQEDEETASNVLDDFFDL